MYDIIIIGGGISGLASSIFLAKKGLKVLVLEKSKTIGENINENFQGFPFYEVPKLTMSIPKDYPVTKAAILASDRSRINLNFKNPICYLVMRGPENSFDSYLADQAINAGVQIELNSRVSGLTMKNGIFNVLRTSDGREYAAKYFIAADGVHSIMRKIVGIRPLEIKGKSYGIKMENVEVEPLQIYGIFNNKIAPRGYSYIIGYPGGRFSTVAVSVRPKYADKPLLYYFNLLLKFIKPLIKKAKQITSFSGSVTCNDGSFEVVRKNILFVGEAGGFQDPALGFGMAPSIRSARIASEIILDSFEKNRLSLLKEFNARTKFTLIRNEIKWKWNLRKMVIEKITDEDLDALIKSLQGQEDIFVKFFETGDWKLLRGFIFNSIRKRPNLLKYLPYLALTFLK